MFLKCPENNCSLIPLLKIKNSKFFEIECNNGHKRESKDLKNFLKSEEIDCQCHSHNKTYNYYCKNCKEDLCFMCVYYSHENHEIIDYSKEMIKKDELKNYEIKLNIFTQKINEINEIINNIGIIKEKVNDLYVFINKFYKDILNIFEKINTIYKFNEIIFKTYKVEFLNYNSMINIKETKDYNEEIKSFKLMLNDLNNIIELTDNVRDKNIFLNINKYLNNTNILSKFDVNTFICNKYCPNWDIRESIREIVQNQIDEIISIVGSKKEIIYEAVGEEYFIENEKIKMNFLFKSKKENKIYGGIEFNDSENELKIWNEGVLENADLLLGSDKLTYHNKDITGRFGEGMKISILTFLRKKKDIIIYTDKKKWTFSLNLDNNFKRKNEPQKCLFWRDEIDYSKKNFEKKRVEIIIKNFSKEEWAKEMDRYLWLTQKKKGIIETTYGDILLNEFFKGQIFVKDSYVYTDFNIYGLNFYGLNLDLQIDRDRNCLVNERTLPTKVCEIVKYVFENMEEIKKKLKENEQSKLENFPRLILDYILANHRLIVDFYSYSNSNIADILWNEYIKIHKDRENCYPYSYCYWRKEKEPGEFMKEKNLPKEFYPYFKCETQNLYLILIKRKNFKTIEQKYKEYIDNFPNVEIPERFKEPIKEIVEKLNLFRNNFKIENIKFKKFNNKKSFSKYFYFKVDNNQFIFSDEIFQDEIDKNWKNKILGICLKLLEIDRDKILELFHLF